MKFAQSTKKVCFLGPVTVATNATALKTIDMQAAIFSGNRYAVVDVLTPPSTATDSTSKWTVLKLTHGTTTDASNHTAISGYVGQTGTVTTATTEFLLYNNDSTTYGGVVRMFVDWTGKERYLGLIYQAAASHAVAAATVSFEPQPNWPRNANDFAHGAASTAARGASVSFGTAPGAS